MQKKKKIQELGKKIDKEQKHKPTGDQQKKKQLQMLNEPKQQSQGQLFDINNFTSTESSYDTFGNMDKIQFEQKRLAKQLQLPLGSMKPGQSTQKQEFQKALEGLFGS